MRGPEIIAHRGASREAPENTMAAINLAWQQGADAVEVDVHQSRDGHIVVIHDAHTRKTARVMRRVRLQTLAELGALDVGRWKHRRWTGEKIPTLPQVLDSIPAGKRLFVEIKAGPECLPDFVNAIKRSGVHHSQVIPIGFNLTTMKLVKWALPSLEVAWVHGFRRNWRGSWTPSADKLIAMAKHAGLDALDLGGRGPVNESFALKVHSAGLKLYIWTVDSPRLARRLAAAGVDGLTTNRPGWLRERLEDRV